MTSILGINTNFKTLNFKNFTETSTQSKTSFLDYDFVIIDTNYIYSKYENYDSTSYNGTTLLSEKESFNIKKDFNNIREQISILLKHFKNIFVLLGNNDKYSVHTGKFEFQGTRKTNFVEPFDTYSFLPTPSSLSISCVEGEKMAFCGPKEYKSFWENIQQCMYYRAYFEKDIGTPLIKTAEMEKTVSCFIEQDNGKIFFLPYPWLEENYKKKYYWKTYGTCFLKNIIELNDKTKKTTSTFNLPSWTKKFLLPNENEERNHLKKLIDNHEQILKNIEEQNKTIENINRYKLLLTATGNQLEEISTNLLSELGFKFTKSEPNRADIIATYDDIPVVFEIKGLTKSAGEKNSAQLEKWASEYLEQYNKQAKAILLINGYKDLPLDKRTEPVFPHQMLKYATSRNHCLITTTQLLCLYIDIKNNKKDKKNIIKDLLKTVGLYKKYTDYKDYIQSEEKISK